MPASLYSYQAPGVTVVNNGAQVLFSSGAPQAVLVMGGTASQGPDFPCLMTPAQALQVFGDPTLPASLGHTLPTGLMYATIQRALRAQQNFLVLAGRVGVTRATIPVLDQTGSPLTCFNIKGIGPYAGSKGNSLSITVNVTATVVTSIQVFDTTSGSPVLKQSFNAAQYDLTSTAKIYAIINGANPLSNPRSIVQCDTFNNAALLPKQQTIVPVGGADGLGTVVGDASVATFLSNSLYVAADYVWMGFDANSLITPMATHINAAVALNNFRKWIGGPKLGTTFTSLSTTYLTSTSSRNWVVGHDGFLSTNPVSNQLTIVDGLYYAAGLAGLKACAGPQETLVGWSVNGFSGVANAVDKTAALTAADLDTLAGAGLIVCEQRSPGSVTIRDLITTAPEYTNNQLNPYYQANVQDIDDAVNYALVRAVLPFKGGPAAPLPVQITQLQAAATSELARLGPTINGINSLVVSADPLTGVPQINLSYITRFPNTRFEITTAFTYV